MNRSHPIQSGHNDACVEQLHQLGNRAADGTLASFPLPHRSNVADAQKRSNAGLCKPDALANGFEGFGGHLEQGFKARRNNSVVNTVSKNWPVEFSKVIALHPRRHVRHEHVSGLVFVGGKADDVGVAGVVIENCNLGHFHSPVSGGALPRCGDTYLHRPNGPVNDNRVSGENFFCGGRR